MKLQFKNQTVNIKCNYCRKVFGVSRDTFEHTVDCVQQRAVGPEYEHSLCWRGECPECQKKIYLEVVAWEYPEECLNYNENYLTGATIETNELELVKEVNVND